MISKQILMVVFALIVIIPFASASLGYFEQDKCVQIKTILNASWVNISTVNYPNSTIALSNVAMDKTGLTFTYDFCSTSILGKYIYDYYDDSGNVYVNDFTITPNGKEPATDVMSVFFMVMFVVILLWMIYSIFLNIREFVSFDLDLFDTLIPMLSYFVLFAYYSFALDYFGNKMVYTFTEQLIQWGAYTHVYFPLLTLSISMIVSGLKRRKDRQENG